MSYCRFLLLFLPLANLTGCAHLFWHDLTGSLTSAPRSSSDANLDSYLAEPGPQDSVEKQLAVLRETDPDRYRKVQELIEMTDEGSSDPMQEMLQRQTHAVLHSATVGNLADDTPPPAHPAKPTAAQDENGPPPARPTAQHRSRRSANASPVMASQQLPPQQQEVIRQAQDFDSAAPGRDAAATIPQPLQAPGSAEQLIAAAAANGTMLPVQLVDGPAPAIAAAAAAAATTEPAPGEDEAAVDWEDLLPQMIGALESLPPSFDDEKSEIEREVFLRLLYMIADRRDDAITPVDRLPESEREYLKHAIYSLMVWLDTGRRHAASRKAALSLRELRLAADHLATHSTLDVRNAVFCSEVMNYGDYVEFKSNVFRGGAEVVLYVEIENFVSEPVGNRFETELQGEYSIFDAQGARVASKVLPLDKQQCNNRRRDYFIAYRLWLPEDLTPGDFTLVLTIEDVKGKKSNQAQVDFRVR